MPELRKDPIVGRWVIIATERARRPGNFVNPPRNFFDEKTEETKCPFCDIQETTIYEAKDERGGHPDSSWDVKVIPCMDPVVSLNTKYKRRGHGLYDTVNGYGTHEVVVETPDHIANMADLTVDQIRMVFSTYAARFKELRKDSHIKYLIAYKNYGWAAGARRIGHSRSQILASSVNPLRVKEKLLGAKRYFEYRDRCLFCDMIRQELQDKKRVVVETAFFVAITPYATRFPFEVWILPKKHHCDFMHGVVGLEEDLAIMMKEVLMRFKVGLGDPAYNYILQTAPIHKKKSGNRWRTIEDDYHWHIEVMPRLTRAAGFEKGTGFYICSIPPEETAAFLREVKI